MYSQSSNSSCLIKKNFFLAYLNHDLKKIHICIGLYKFPLINRFPLFYPVWVTFISYFACLLRLVFPILFKIEKLFRGSVIILLQGKNNSVAIQEIVETALSYATFSCKGL